MSDTSVRTNVSSSPLFVDSEAFRRAGHKLVDEIASHMSKLQNGLVKVTPAHSVQEVRQALDFDRPCPSESEGSIDALLGEATSLMLENSLFVGHPKFYGYVVGAPNPVAVLGDLLASWCNANCGGWVLSPMATEIELQTLRWLAELIGFPAEAPAGGILVSGGNMANFVPFWAARHRMIVKHATKDEEFSVAADRLCSSLRVYTTKGTHTWMDKAAELSGISRSRVRYVAERSDGCMDTDDLAAKLEQDTKQGLLPMLICGNAGTVSSGAVDDLKAIRQLCNQYGAWHHVDGAYGGVVASLARSETVPTVDVAGVASIESDGARVAQLSLADSVAIDPHKWLCVPLECGATLVRDVAALTSCFSHMPNYYQLGDETQFFARGFQNSRGFRALKVWLSLRYAGANGYRRIIGQDCALARRLALRVQQCAELEFVSCSLSITLFRFVPTQLRDSSQERINAVNKQLQHRLERAGEAFVSNAITADGSYVLRACLVNFATTDGDIDALPDIVCRIGHQVLQENEK